VQRIPISLLISRSVPKVRVSTDAVLLFREVNV